MPRKSLQLNQLSLHASQLSLLSKSDRRRYNWYGFERSKIEIAHAQHRRVKNRMAKASRRSNR